MTELIYIIDPVRLEDNLLTIKIQEAVREGFVLKPISNQRLLTKPLLLQLQSDRDVNLLSFLVEQENAYSKKSLRRQSETYSTVRIAYTSMEKALKFFALSGKLYFRDKCLTIDLYGQTDFFYTVDNSKIIGKIKTNTFEIPITECDFVGRGSPNWFIKGIHLKCITTDVSWKDLKNAFDGRPQRIEDLLEDAKHDPNAPRIVMQDAALLTPQGPLPVLVLTDRSGGFANLFLDYGDNQALVDFHDPKNSGRIKNRQMQAEIEWEKDLLETDFIKKIVGGSHYYCPMDKVAKSLTFLLEIGWKIRDWRNNTVLRQTQISLTGTSSKQNILIQGKIHYGDFDVDVKDIVGAFNKRERFAEISPGHVALLPSHWESTGLENLIEEGELTSEGIKIKNYSIGTLSGLFENQPQMGLDDSLKNLKAKLDTFKGINRAIPGPEFKGQLRPYQQEGVDWLAFLHEFHFHGMLADDMGLGKTVQVIAFLSRFQFQKPVLIVVPTSLIFNWQREIARFLNQNIMIHHGPNRINALEVLNIPQIILTTYSTLRIDFSLFSQLSYDFLILDEAQAIKNSHTQTFQSVAALKADFRLSITGTPIENNLLELWSHFRFLIPDLFGEESAFQAELQAGQSDPRFFKRIKRQIRPFMLRRRKEDVAKDLPEKIEQTVWVEMEDSQRVLYDTFLSGIRRNLISKVNVDGVSKHRMEILEAIMRLRQICCHPLLVSQLDTLPEGVLSAKLETLLEDLETALKENRKVLVYSQFTSMLGLIGRRLKEKGWNYLYLDGSTKDRQSVVDQFQNDPSINFFLISLKAGGIGLNLTAADYVFLYDPWWNASVENQAIDRAHRIGRKDTVIAKRYVMAESIEEKMMKLKEAKSNLAADLFDDEGVISSISADDLLFLLS